MALKHIVYPKD